MRTAKTLIRLGGCQSDLSLRWEHTHFVGFVISRLTLRLLLLMTEEGCDRLSMIVVLLEVF